MSNWPMKWGFIGDLRECIGKTVADVEVLRMEYGCTVSQCHLIRFTDSSRCFIVDGPGKGIVPSPALEEMKKSKIITPEEIGEIEAYLHRKRLEKDREQKQRDEAAFRELAKRLGKEPK